MIRPKRILILVEGEDGTHLGIELKHGALDPLVFGMEAWPTTGQTYLGDGKYSDPSEAWITFLASGVHEIHPTTNLAGWLASKAVITPDQANNTVNASQRLELGGNG